MKKKDFLKRYGGAAFKKWRQQSRDWMAQWRKDNPDKVKANHQEEGRKGGKYYGKHLENEHTGIRGERNKIRMKHTYLYRNIKEATPNSQIHHEWLPGTADFRGVALVERDAHQNGIIKIIKVLEGRITLFTEKEISKQEVGK